jgi:Ca2+-binding EF-hand superfamily protein
MTHKSLLLATLLVAIAGPAFAQQSQMPAPQAGNGQRPSPFERADSNNDGVITREEIRLARTATFTRLDANRDGFLVREEMPPPPHGRRGDDGPDGMRHRGEDRDGARHEGGQLLRQSDANNDGNVTRAEFDAAWARSQMANASAIDARKARAFARLDTNNDGTITRAEADAVRVQMQGQRAEEGGDRQRRGGGHVNPDTNNDQKISLAEWLARPDPMFDRGDANKDGRVTREEAAAATRQGREIRTTSTKRPW